MQRMERGLGNAFKTTGDQRLLRAKLMVSELGELCFALAKREEVDALDGLADLLYVVVGTGVQFGLPIEKAFIEVHNSNMTKSSAAARHDGDRGKGEGFVPADIGRVIREHAERPDYWPLPHREDRRA